MSPISRQYYWLGQTDGIQVVSPATNQATAQIAEPGYNVNRFVFLPAKPVP